MGMWNDDETGKEKWISLTNRFKKMQKKMENEQDIGM